MLSELSNPTILQVIANISYFPRNRHVPSVVDFSITSRPLSTASSNVFTANPSTISPAIIVERFKRALDRSRKRRDKIPGWFGHNWRNLVIWNERVESRPEPGDKCYWIFINGSLLRCSRQLSYNERTNVIIIVTIMHTASRFINFGYDILFVQRRSDATNQVLSLSLAISPCLSFDFDAI